MAYFLPQPSSFVTVPYMGSSAFVNGLEMNVISTTQFTISPGSARDLVSDIVMANPALITVDVTTLGSNGCYPYLPAQLSPANNTVYPVYIVGNPSGTSGMINNPSIIVATGNEFLPPGMVTLRRIGWIYINAGTAGTIYKWSQSGSGTQRTYTLAALRSRVFAASPTTYTPISMTSVQGIVPPKNNVIVLLNVYISTDSAGQGAFFSFTTSETGRTGAAYVLSPVVGQNIGVPLQVVCGQDPTTKDSTLYYKVTTAGTDVSIDCCGFVDELSNTLY